MRFDLCITCHQSVTRKGYSRVQGSLEVPEYCSRDRGRYTGSKRFRADPLRYWVVNLRSIYSQRHAWERDMVFPRQLRVHIKAQKWMAVGGTSWWSKSTLCQRREASPSNLTHPSVRAPGSNFCCSSRSSTSSGGGPRSTMPPGCSSQLFLLSSSRRRISFTRPLLNLNSAFAAFLATLWLYSVGRILSAASYITTLSPKALITWLALWWHAERIILMVWFAVFTGALETKGLKSILWWESANSKALSKALIVCHQGQNASWHHFRARAGHHDCWTPPDTQKCL